MENKINWFMSNLESAFVSGHYESAKDPTTINHLNGIALYLLGQKVMSQDDINNLGLLIKLCNILYNNTDMDPLPIEDGLYDVLMEKYKYYVPNYQVGASPTPYYESVGNIVEAQTPPKPAFIHVNPKMPDEPLFVNEIVKTPHPKDIDFIRDAFVHLDYLNKGLRNTAHNYPELVGTLDKYKFVMNFQAEDAGVFNDSNVKVLERDFFQPIIEAGILDPNKEFTVVAELKYDGISIEADVCNGEIVSARSRGDTNNDEATDFTPILKGYKFRHATDPRLPKETFGMKFEAIITYDNLERMREMYGKNYVNGRNAIIGIFGSSNAREYQQFITLVPLATSLKGMNRIEELEFMNKYYHSGERCRYTVFTGDFTEVMYLITTFVEEAEYMRPILPCMYDGVVISFVDENIRQALGRVNSVNKYSAAVKFNTEKKYTRFIGYSYTVGQTGVITPMINYNPIEFYGMIQTKSSAHSYKRFKELQLRVGDVVQAEYVNDVMTYITKPNIEENIKNELKGAPIVEFITHCPECGSELVESDSGKSIYCPNINCPGRRVARMVGMFKKINFKGIAEETVKDMNVYSLKEFMELSYDDLLNKGFGPDGAYNIFRQIREFKATPIFDYRIIGSLGFTNLAESAWKNILQHISLEDVVDLNDNDLRSILSQIKGLGPVGIETIIEERKIYEDDIRYVLSLPNVGRVRNLNITGKHIRFSGCRDKDLVQTLQEMGHDASDGAVTKNTDILLVPTPGYTSSKVSKLPPTAVVIPINEFRAHLDLYLS